MSKGHLRTRTHTACSSDIPRPFDCVPAAGRAGNVLDVRPPALARHAAAVRMTLPSPSPPPVGLLGAALSLFFSIPSLPLSLARAPLYKVADESVVPPPSFIWCPRSGQVSAPLVKYVFRECDEIATSKVRNYRPGTHNRESGVCFRSRMRAFIVAFVTTPCLLLTNATKPRQVLLCVLAHVWPLPRGRQGKK